MARMMSSVYFSLGEVDIHSVPPACYQLLLQKPASVFHVSLSSFLSVTCFHRQMSCYYYLTTSPL